MSGMRCILTGKVASLSGQDSAVLSQAVETMLYDASTMERRIAKHGLFESAETLQQLLMSEATGGHEENADGELRQAVLESQSSATGGLLLRRFADGEAAAS